MKKNTICGIIYAVFICNGAIMDELKEKINNLKEKIIIAIDKYDFYPDLKYTKEHLLSELNNKKYDKDNEMSVKRYYAWLLSFYENKIGLLNKSVIDNKNNNIFDNSEKSQLDRINELQNEIEKTLNDVNNTYPEFSDNMINSYKALKEYYETEFDNVLDISRKRFNIDIGIIDKPIKKRIIIDKENDCDKVITLPETPVFSLYTDPYTERQAYVNRLECFNKSCESIKIFYETDQKIKQILKNAYDVITDPQALEMIKEIEKNYINGIRQSVKDRFMFLGPDQIQESMSKSCEYIEEMTNKEIAKNNYYQKIMTMTLNISSNEVIDVLNYVDSNNLFVEEFYYNLYILLEKEKYLLAEYNAEPKIYNQLNDKQKMKLERMFMNRLNDYSEIDAAKTSEQLIKYGYINTLDIDYQNYFNDRIIVNKQEYNMIEEKPYMRMNVHNYTTLYGDLGTYKSLYVNYTDRDDVHINAGKQSGDKTHYFEHVDKDKFSNHDYIFLKKSSSLSIGNIALNYHTGDITKLRGVAKNCKHYFFGYFMCKKDNLLYLFDKEIKLKKVIKDVFSCFIDVVKELFIMSNGDGYLSVYDKDLELIKEFDISPVIKGEYSIYSVNDGVITISLNDKHEILYYDYINMKIIDKFKKNDYISNTEELVYSDGLYCYIDGDYMGYKDINGVIRIKPQFNEAGPFLGNVARVKYSGIVGVIDRAGNFTPENDYRSNLFENIKKNILIKYPDCSDFKRYSFLNPNSKQTVTITPDFTEGMYKINLYLLRVGYLKAEDNYIFDIDLPIKEINFGISKERQLKK